MFALRRGFVIASWLCLRLVLPLLLLVHYCSYTILKLRSVVAGEGEASTTPLFSLEEYVVLGGVVTFSAFQFVTFLALQQKVSKPKSS